MIAIRREISEIESGSLEGRRLAAAPPGTRTVYDIADDNSGTAFSRTEENISGQHLAHRQILVGVGRVDNVAVTAQPGACSCRIRTTVRRRR